MFLAAVLLARWPAWAHVAVGLLGLASALPAASDPPASPWRTIASDLPRDPALREGTLPNGLRFLILPNAEPRGHLSLRLVVAAGAWHERDDERGLAHFVEHMAFRGTRDFRNGSVLQTLQRLGLGLGPDAAAFTTMDYTIYHLELPDTKPATLAEALHVFHQFASAVTFDEKLLAQERGVVLSEKAMRDKPDARAADFHLRFLWPQSREAQRKVIGTTEAIRTFSRAQCLAFYDAWYRPERMGIVAVGDIDPALLERALAEKLGALRSRAPAREAPPPEPPPAAPPNVEVFDDPGLVGCTIQIEHPRLITAGPDTHARRMEHMRDALAMAMLHGRMQRLASAADASFVRPAAVLAPGVRDWQIATLTASGRLDDWKQVATDLEREHRRAYFHGFTPRELEEARASFQSFLDQSVRSAATRASPQLAGELVNTLVYGARFVTPASFRDDAAGELANVTRAECQEAFRRVWSSRPPSVLVLAHPSFAVTRQQIAEVLNHSRETDVTAPAEAATPPFAYQDFGAPGALVAEQPLADLDARLARFANNVCLNFKATPFEADFVHVRVRIGDGKLSQPVSRPGLDLLARAAFVGGGLGRHTTQELRDILSGHMVQLRFEVETDALVLSAVCARRELRLALRMIAAFVTDPAYRPEAMRDARAQFSSIFASLASSPGGPITMRALRLCYGGDARFGLPDFNEVSARDLGELAAWLDPQLKAGAIEASIVGDTTWDEAREAFAQTLGALPTRQEVQERGPLVPLVPATPDVRVSQVIFPIDPRLGQAAIAWYWPVAEVADTHEERRCHLLAQVMAERLRARLRDDAGATYFPQAAFVRTNGFPHANYFSFYAEVAPARLSNALAVIEREFRALAKSGPGADEFARAKQPYVRGMTDDLRTNVYWSVTVLGDAQQRPNRITAARDRATDIAAITREEVTALARRHLPVTRAFKFATLPVTPAQAAAKTGTGSAASPAPSARAP